MYITGIRHTKIFCKTMNCICRKFMWEEVYVDGSFKGIVDVDCSLENELQTS